MKETYVLFDEAAQKLKLKGDYFLGVEHIDFLGSCSREDVTATTVSFGQSLATCVPPVCL